MSKSLSQYVNYTIGQYILNNDNINGVLLNKYYKKFKSLLKQDERFDDYSNSELRHMFSCRTNIIYDDYTIRKILDKEVYNILDCIENLRLKYEHSPTSSDYYGFECHYRKLGVPFDKLVYQNKLF